VNFLSPNIHRIAVVCFAVLAVPLTGCKPEKLEKIKVLKQEKADLDAKEAAVAMEVASLNSQLSVLGKDSQAAETAVDRLQKRKQLLEREDARLDKLAESISGQKTALEKEHQAYRTKYQPKPL
jgi:septal ring factor EnvC (AmiA/AmiB activator)